jgi:hypothetical protein
MCSLTVECVLLGTQVVAHYKTKAGRSTKPALMCASACHRDDEEVCLRVCLGFRL